VKLSNKLTKLEVFIVFILFILFITVGLGNYKDINKEASLYNGPIINRKIDYVVVPYREDINEIKMYYDKDTDGVNN